MRKTITAVFYNEEYLLPWWLMHHKQYFDHGVLINYASTGDKDAAKSGVYSHAYVHAVIALDRALKPIWRADQTLLNVITQTIKTITARANYAAFIIKQTINNHLIPSTFLDSLLTKIIPAHAPTAVHWDAA